MHTSNKVAFGLIGVIAGILLIQHANLGLQPARPVDMPADAHFVVSSYDLTRNEAKGDWVACKLDRAQNTDFCRVTDDRGYVVYQGDFLPLRSEEPIPAEQLQVAPMNMDHLFVKGPAEAGLVPVIKLMNGTLLVPVADNEALVDRWSVNPEELRKIEE